MYVPGACHDQGAGRRADEQPSKTSSRAAEQPRNEERGTRNEGDLVRYGSWSAGSAYARESDETERSARKPHRTGGPRYSRSLAGSHVALPTLYKDSLVSVARAQFHPSILLSKIENESIIDEYGNMGNT